MDSAEPTLPIEANEPTLPTDSTEPFDPIDSRLSEDHSDQREFLETMPEAWQRLDGVSMHAVAGSMTDNAWPVADGEQRAGASPSGIRTRRPKWFSVIEQTVHPRDLDTSGRVPPVIRACRHYAR